MAPHAYKTANRPLQSNLWLADWSDAELRKHTIALTTGAANASNATEDSIYLRLGVFTLLGVGQVVFVCIAATLVTLGM